MKEANLRPADIIIFEAGDDWIGKSIAWLTKSTVSHAALYRPEGELVEMGMSGIGANKFHTVEKGAKAYVMRLNPEHDPAPVLAAADKYLQAKIRYDFPALVILGGLLIYRTIRPTPKLQKITDLILSAACQALDKLLQAATKSSGAMVCSQLVYQCYLDSGEEYHIRLHDGNLVTAPLGTVCLNTLLEERKETQKGTLAGAAPAEVPQETADSISDPNALAQELYEAMTEEADENAMLNVTVPKELLNRAEQFLKLVEAILEKADDVIPVQALFVTPGDLLNHATNLTQVATVNIERN